MADSPNVIGKLLYDIGADVTRLDKDLRDSERKILDSARRTEEKTTKLVSSFNVAATFGKIAIGINAASVGITALSAVAAVFRGDIDAAEEAIAKLPFGLGAAYQILKQMSLASLGIAQQMEEATKRGAEFDAKIAEVGKQKEARKTLRGITDAMKDETQQRVYKRIGDDESIAIMQARKEADARAAAINKAADEGEVPLNERRAALARNEINLQDRIREIHEDARKQRELEAQAVVDIAKAEKERMNAAEKQAGDLAEQSQREKMLARETEEAKRRELQITFQYQDRLRQLRELKEAGVSSGVIERAQDRTMEAHQAALDAERDRQRQAQKEKADSWQAMQRDVDRQAKIAGAATDAQRERMQRQFEWEDKQKAIIAAGRAAGAPESEILRTLDQAARASVGPREPRAEQMFGQLEGQFSAEFGRLGGRNEALRVAQDQKEILSRIESNTRVMMGGRFN